MTGGPPRGRAALVAAIEASRPGWTGPHVETAVFGTGAAARVAERIDELCRTHLGSPVSGVRGYHASVGCTAVVVLVDGRAVAVKAHQPRWTEPFLRAVTHVQGHLALLGYPAPRPLAGPVPVTGPGPADAAHRAAGTWASIDEALPDPLAPSAPSDPVPGEGPVRAAAPAPGAADRGADRSVSAAGLAHLVALARPLVGAPEVAPLAAHPLHGTGPGIGPGWGEPHSPLFDFALSTPEAGAIDDLAAVARAAALDPSDPVIAHGDWAARNVRIVAGRLAAVFDWDSLLVGPESTAVGQAGLTWDDTGDGDGACPSAPGVAAFVADYEQHRGRAFTGAQRRAAGAAALHTLCYRARCEAALTARWPEVPHSRAGRDRLAAEGDALLRLDQLLR